MPVVRDIPLTLQTNEILRRTGIKEDSKLKCEMETLIGQLLVSVNDEHLLEPAIVYETYPITDVGYQQLSLEGNAVACTVQYFPRFYRQPRNLLRSFALSVASWKKR